MATSVQNIAAKCSRLLLGLSALGLASTADAQTYNPSGYDYLGTYNGHEYYISQARIRGLDIGTTVTDFRTKTGVDVNQAYAAAIVNAGENNAVQNMMLTYNQNKYGVTAPGNLGIYTNLTPGSKSNFPNWGDPRNPWIGLSDASIEQVFSWINGQPNCEDYRNWNIGEPNNYTGELGGVSNGEDFTQMLIMNMYDYNNNSSDGAEHDPLGKWNDWFNDMIVDPVTSSMNGPTRLPLIIEVGPAECQAGRGNLGCSHGYWKNASDKSWNDGGLSRQAKFYLVFNITNGRNVLDIAGADATSMQQALELKGGGYAQVAKQGVGAYMNAIRGYYPYTSSEIVAAVQAMFNTGSATLPAVVVNGTSYTGGSFTSAGALASYLDMLNNLGCPLDNHGNFTNGAGSRRPASTLTETASKTFSVSGYPNPTRGHFSLQIAGLTTESVTLRVTDMTGRLVEQRANIPANQVVSIGSNYKAGLYYVEVEQGGQKKQLKMIKQ